MPRPNSAACLLLQTTHGRRRTCRTKSRRNTRPTPSISSCGASMRAWCTAWTAVRWFCLRGPLELSCSEQTCVEGRHWEYHGGSAVDRSLGAHLHRLLCCARRAARHPAPPPWALNICAQDNGGRSDVYFGGNKCVQSPLHRSPLLASGAKQPVCVAQLSAARHEVHRLRGGDASRIVGLRRRHPRRPARDHPQRGACAHRRLCVLTSQQPFSALR